MIRFLIQPMLDRAYAKGYQDGMNDALDESDRRRAEALEKVWRVIDEPTIPGPAPAESNVVAIHLRRADGKWHL